MGDISMNPDVFRAWLLAQDEDEVVGTATRAGECPLARFLNEQAAGGERYEVGEVFYWAYDASGCSVEAAPLPAWAERFVGLVDRWCGGVPGRAVTRRVALRLLDACCAS